MDFPEYARAVESQPGLSRPERNLIAVRQTASTHLLGRRVVDEYSRESLRPPDTDLIAWTQTAGVGRGNRKWSSPAGKGIYLTSIRSLDSSHRLQLLPVSMAVSFCETVNRWLCPGDSSAGGDPRAEAVCRLKWPNDLFAGGRKLGGILIDVLSPGGGRRAPEPSKPLASLRARAAAGRTQPPIAIISVGINVDRDLPAFEHPQATSVAVEAERRGLAVIPLAAAVRELIAAIDAGLAAESPRWLETYGKLSLHRPGDQMHCRLDSGAVTGTFLGFDSRGFLRLRVAGAEKRISSGVIADDS